MNRLFIAGCGYSGSAVAREARNEGWLVTCHLRDKARGESLAEEGFDTVVFGIDGVDSIPALPLSGQVLLYSVPPQGGGSVDLRAAGFISAMERDQAIPSRVVYLSATSVYGDTGGAPVNESSPAMATSAMGKRRLDAERLFDEFGKRHGIPVVILRISGIYGPGRLPLMQISQGQPLLAEELAKPSNRIHRDDLVQVCLAVLNGGDGIYNVSDGCPVSMTAYFNACADILGYPRQPQVGMDEAMRVMPPLLFNYFKESRVVDNSRIIGELGIRLRYPSMSEGLKASLPTGAL